MEGRDEKSAIKKHVILAKDNSWFAKVTDHEIDILLKEKAIQPKKGKEKTFVARFTNKELKNYIKIRENGKCLFCKKGGEDVFWLVPKNQGGYETPTNLIYTCKKCKREKIEETKTEEWFTYVKKVKQTNIEKFKNNENATICCENCKHFKKMEHFAFIKKEQELAYCNKCFKESKKGTFFLLNEENDFIGIAQNDYIHESWKEGKIEYIDQKLVRVFNEAKKKRCILCGKMKWKNSYRKKENKERKHFCKQCEKDKASEGLISLKDRKGKLIMNISSDKAKRLEHKRVAYFSENLEMIFTSTWEQQLFLTKKWLRSIFLKDKDYVVVSISGKWSANISEKDASLLIKEGLAEIHQENVLRLVFEIEEFKNKIMERDQYICKFCGGKGTGVYSEGKVRMYSNSYCTCLECEYEHVPNKLLKWLNLTEERRMTRLKTTYLYEKNNQKKYRIDKQKAAILIKEKMARVKDNKTILLYTPKEFRAFILKRDKRLCYYCGKKGDTIDHVVPRSKNGLTTIENCVCACETCNNKKGSLDKDNFVDLLENN